MVELKLKPAAGRAWALFGLAAVVALTGVGLNLADAAGPAPLPGWPERVIYAGVSVLFALLATFIGARQPRNVIGWLLLAQAGTLALAALNERSLSALTEPPAVVSAWLQLRVWYSGWSWLLVVMPVVLIPLFFPTGRPPSARWRWVTLAVAMLAVYFLAVVTFSERLRPSAVYLTWTVPNPIGFLDDRLVEALLAPWGGGLAALVVLSVASLFLRYRRADAVVRAQIRWLLYACGFFALIYVPGFFLPLETPTGGRTLLGEAFDMGFLVAVIAIPTAIALAILRYRLWDIDVIIRRTLIYSVLTGLLALLYVGSVLVLQPLLAALAGPGTQLATVLSTLVIAALFLPLRRRVQGFIDRRFYRGKYDAARALAEFAASARDETDLTQLTERLALVVEQTVQPAHLSLWLRSRRGKQP